MEKAKEKEEMKFATRTRVRWLGFACLLATIAVSCDRDVVAQESEFYSVNDYPNVPKIDAHMHVHTETTDFVSLALRDDFRFVNMAVWSDNAKTNVEKHRTMYLQFRAFPDRIAPVCSFPIENFDDDDFAEATIRYLDDQIAKGAVGVKVWKNIGMELRNADGDLVMIDDAKFDPIMKHIAAKDLVLLGHLGEPKNCWLPLDQMTTNNDRSYFSEHPKYHMFLHQEMPSYEDQIAARDAMLEKNPDVKFFACHLASLEWSTARMTAFLERFPNAVLDVAARMGQLQYQSQRDRDAMIDFITNYQDRIIYGSDTGVGPKTNVSAKYEYARARWLRDWEYFTSDTMVKVPELDDPVQGLRLPKTIVDKLYRTNAMRLFSRSFRKTNK